MTASAMAAYNSAMGALGGGTYVWGPTTYYDYESTKLQHSNGVYYAPEEGGGGYEPIALQLEVAALKQQQKRAIVCIHLEH